MISFRLRRNDIEDTALPFLAQLIAAQETALPFPNFE